MGINITQFAPPSRVSSLVWDKNMEPPAGKVFEGDLVGDVTGDVTGDLTGVVRGSLLGYLSRNGVVSASSGALVVPASSSTGNTAVTVNLNLGDGGTYAIVGNTQKCYLENPCYIPVVLEALPGWGSANYPLPYAKSFTSDGALIDSISTSGNLNIYGASYIELYGGTYEDDEYTQYNRTMSVADAYIDAGTSLILGDDTPPDGPKVSKLVWDSDMVPAAGKKFVGKTAYEWTMTPSSSTAHALRVPARSTTQVYQVSPGDTLTGSLRLYTSSGTPQVVNLLYVSNTWDTLLDTQLSDTPSTYTLPEGTNGIYVRNDSDNYVLVRIIKFTIT